MPETLTYRKKITASCGWLRPVQQPEPLMRVECIVEEGWEEMSAFGPFIRWIGKFRATAIQRDGSFDRIVSRNLIMPSVASDYLSQLFARKDKGEVKTGMRTGGYYAPAAEGALEVACVFDLWLLPPHNEAKPSQTGYEFDCRVVRQSGDVDVFTALASDLPVFALTALPVPAAEGTTPPAPAAEVTSEPETVPEEHTHSRRKKA